MVHDTPPVTQETRVNKTDKTPAAAGTRTLVGKARKYIQALCFTSVPQSRQSPWSVPKTLPVGVLFFSPGAF